MNWGLHCLTCTFTSLVAVGKSNVLYRHSIAWTPWTEPLLRHMRRYNPKQSQVSFLYLPNTPNLPAVTSTFLYINVCKEKISILLNTQGIVMIQSNKAPTSQHTYWDTSAASVAKNVCSCLAKLTMEAEVGMLGGPAGLKKAGNCKPPLHAHNPVSRLPWACSRLVDTCTRDGAVSGTFQAKILEESDPSTAKKKLHAMLI